MRYSRQEILIGSRNQKKLQKALVTVVGCGGIGSAAAEYLARAGVNLRLIDRDIVELSNTQRQLFREEDVGRPKADALRERLEEINSEIKIESVDDDLNPSNIDFLSGSSIVIDGTDNMETRFLVNDFCLKNRMPFTYAAAIKSEGLFTLVVPKETACIRCFIPKASVRDTCETAGVLGPAVGLIGVISAGEAIKYLIGKECIKGHLFHMNFYKNLYELIEIKRSKNCPACQGSYSLDAEKNQIIQLCGGTYQFLFDNNVNVSDISEKLKKARDFKVLNISRNFSQISYKNYMISLFRNRMVVQGAKNEKEMKILAAKIIGL